jgi:hypothetical protein
MDNRVELGQPARRLRRIEIGLARSIERLIAETREHERDQILDLGAADADVRRLGDEPLGSASQLAGIAVAPEVIARLALGERHAVARGERPIRVRATEPAENQDLLEVDEGQPRRAAANVVHQQRNALRVVDHRHTPTSQQTAFAGRVASLPLQERELCEAGTHKLYAGSDKSVKVSRTDQRPSCQ